MKSEATNPYVGLRPYEADESLLFFGRAEQTLELLQRLHEHHFVAVVGSSGCGKSSLLRAGLIPTLKAGYLVEDSDHWLIGIMKPGSSPLYNLAETLLKQVDPEIKSEAIAEFVEKIKEEGADALLDLIAPLRKAKKLNFFLLVDQFEELFRFAMDQKDVNKKDEAIDFVNIMLELSNQSIIPVYVVMTMRSDFIGDCAQFYGLPEAMNKSLYLVPKLNRLQLKRVIESPAKLFGGKLNPSLTSLLLNELGKVKDELPLLQHALMRMWDFEVNVDKNGEVDLQDYENIGGLEKALSKHADEALVGMSTEDLWLTKHIFQALTAIDENGRKIRRPVLLSELKKLTGAKEEKIIKIINLFIKDKRSFLIVNNAGNSGDKVIDISHESLIRQWTTLSDWVDEEGESAAYYLQLNEAANLNKQERKDFLTGTELQLALDWYRNFKPTADWADRYKKGFKLSEDYLIESEKAQNVSEYKEKRRKVFKKRLITSIIILLFIVTLGSLVGGYYVNEKRIIALEKTLEADSLAKEALNRAEALKISENQAQMATVEALMAKEVAFNEAKRADSSAREAIKQKEFALKQTKRADDLAIEAIAEKKNAQANYLISEANRNINHDPTLALNLASQALQINGDEIIHEDALSIYRDHSFYKIVINESSSIYSATYSPDGKTIVTTSGDNKARLWKLNGKMKQELSGHTAIISSVVFSPDGKTILTGSHDSTARLWNLNGSLIQTFKGHNGYISSVAFSSDGQLILTASGDKTARLWNLNGETIAVLMGHESKVIDVAFSPKGNIMLTGSGDKTARLWNMQGETIESFEDHTDYISSVAFSPDGQLIATGSGDETVRLWNLNGESIKLLKGHAAAISSVVFSPNGKSVLSGSYDNTARLWNLNGDVQQEFKGHSAILSSAAFSPDGEAVMTASWDKTVRSWLIKGETKQEFIGHTDNIPSLAFSPDGKTILSGSWDKTARLWNLKGELLQNFPGHTDFVTSVAFSPNGKTILTGSYDRTARLWNLNGESIQLFNGHSDVISSVAFSPDGKNILTGSGDSTILLWNLQGEIIQEFSGHKGPIYAIAFSPDGKTILSSSADKTARLWNLEGEMMNEFKNLYLSSIAFSPDGEMILTGSYDMTARLWSLQGNMIQTFAGHKNIVSSIAFSPDGNTILTGSYDESAHLWNMHGEMIQDFTGHSLFISSVAFSPDGKNIITGSGDNTIRLWEVAMPMEDFLKSEWLEPLTAEQKKQFKID